MQINQKHFKYNIDSQFPHRIDSSKSASNALSGFNWKTVGSMAKIAAVALGLLNPSTSVNALFLPHPPQCMTWNTSRAPFLSCMQSMSFNDCFDQMEIDPNSLTALKWKMMSHTWEIDFGAVKYNDFSFRSNGMKAWASAALLSNSIEMFSNLFPGLISEDELLQIKSLMKWTTRPIQDLNPQAILHDYIKGHPIILLNEITTETSLHAVQVVLVDHFLMVANKGRASRGPLEIFVIDRDNVTEDTIKKIVRKKSLSEYEQWLNFIYCTIGDKQNDLSLLIEKTYPFPKKQVIGNCAWESLETAFYGWWMVNRLKSHSTSLPTDENLKAAQNVFITWLEYAQVSSLENITGIQTNRSNIIKKKILKAAPAKWAHPELGKRFSDVLNNLITT